MRKRLREVLREHNRWQCSSHHDRRQFTLKTGTIIKDFPIGLDKWLPALWLLSSNRNGVSSWELHRAWGVTQKPAWFMPYRLTKLHFRLDCVMEEINPNLYRSTPVWMRTGNRPVSADGFPLIGQTSWHGLFILSGTYRDGFHQSLVLAMPELPDSVIGEHNGSPKQVQVICGRYTHV